MTTVELNRIKSLMPAYSEHLKKNGSSLLSKILGIFTVQTENFSSVNIMLMENTIRLKKSKQLRYIFDLKGSTVDRVVTGKTKNLTTLKDINFLIAKKRFKNLTELDKRTSKRLVAAMRNDVEFLRQQRLMDYSLLLAIEKTDNSKAELHNESSVARFGMLGFDPSGVSG
jgi:hypothetical protein